MLDDGRLELAKALPIEEVAHRLGITWLRRATATEKVGACPVCGGHEKRDSDRFSINTARGVWLCRRCPDNAKGDGLALVQHVNGCDFKAALTFLTGGPETVDHAEIERRKRLAAEAKKKSDDYAAKARARAIRDAREIWHAAEPGAGSPAEAYLAGRGLRFQAWPQTLRYVPRLVYRKKGVEYAGPAMVAAIARWPDRQVCAVHQTFLDLDRPGQKAQIKDLEGAPAPAKLVRGSMKGGAIRLTPLGDSGVLIMGEGIETTASALCANAIPGAAYWAGVSLGNMAGIMAKTPGKKYSGEPLLTDDQAFVPPAGVKRLIFIQDADSEPNSTRARLLSGLRRAQHADPSRQVQIVPAAAGGDLNDDLLR